MDTTETSNISWIQKRPLLWIVLGGLALRLLFLGKESLWLDELASADFTAFGLSKAVSAEPTNPPLYYVVLYAFRSIFGASEAALRFPSVIFGTASVYLVYDLGRRLGLNQAALLAAGWTAASSFMISYSQEARCFSLLTLLILLSTIFLIRLVTERGSLLVWAGYVLATTLALYTHFYAILYVVAENVAALAFILKRRLSLPSWVTLQLIILTLFSPWLIRMLSAAAGHGQTRRYLLLKLPQTFFSLVFGDTIVPLDEVAVSNISGTLFAALPELLVCGLTAVFLLFCLVHAAYRQLPIVFLPLTIALVPLFLSFIVSFRIMIFDERYLSPSAPLIFLALAGSVEFSFRSVHPRARLCSVLSILGVGAMLSFGLQNLYLNPRFGKEQWREAIGLVDSRVGERDVILFDPDYASLGWDYYSSRKGVQLFKVVEKDETTVPAFLREQQELLHSAPNVWLIRSHQKNDRMRDGLQEILSMKEYFPFPRDKGIEVYRFSGTGF